MTTDTHAEPEVRLRIGRLVGSELVKLRATPSAWWLAGLAMAAVLLGIVITLSTQDIGSAADVRALLSFATTSGLVTILLGLVWTAGEYRHRTIVTAALLTPRRWAFVLAQVGSLALVGLLVGLVGTALAVAVTYGWLGSQDGAPGTSPADLLQVTVGTMAYAGIAAALGGGLGALVRNQVAAAIAIFLYLSMVDPLVGIAVPAYGQFGPTAIGIAMTGADPQVVGGPGAQLLAPIVATAVWLGYAAVLVTAGILATGRRELP